MDNKLKIKFTIAVLAVIISLTLGAYTKVMMILHFSDPFKFWLNLILYVFSWLMMFGAAFVVGKEALKLAEDYVKTKMSETYATTRNIERKGREEVASITKKGFHFTKHHIKETAKNGIKNTKKFHRRTIKMHKRILRI